MAEPLFDARLRDEVLPQIEHQEDRVVAIVLTAIVEDQLRTAVTASVADEQQTIKRMFGGFGPLSSFSALTDMGLLLALYRDDFARALHAMRKIRNAFAHDPLISTFDTPSFAAQIETLGFIERYNPQRILTPRKRFIGASHFMLGAFYMIISTSKRPAVSDEIGTLGP